MTVPLVAKLTRARSALVLDLLYRWTSTLPPARRDVLNLSVSVVPLTAQPEIVGPV